MSDLYTERQLARRRLVGLERAQGIAELKALEATTVEDRRSWGWRIDDICREIVLLNAWLQSDAATEGEGDGW